MARYRVIHWRQIPSLVEAVESDQIARVPLSQRFQDLIDAVAMREGASDTDLYLAGWEQGPDHDRPGTAAAVAEQVAAELEAGFPDLLATRFLPQPRGPA
ncbi:MAG TPA: virulence factor [Candidatus Methylomirabilis sp.]|nr:virulence factor [Candidatus Methylomirabilis sp.]